MSGVCRVNVYVLIFESRAIFAFDVVRCVEAKITIVERWQQRRADQMRIIPYWEFTRFVSIRPTVTEEEREKEESAMSFVYQLFTLSRLRCCIIFRQFNTLRHYTLPRQKRKLPSISIWVWKVQKTFESFISLRYFRFAGGKFSICFFSRVRWRYDFFLFDKLIVIKLPFSYDTKAYTHRNMYAAFQ